MLAYAAKRLGLAFLVALAVSAADYSSAGEISLQLRETRTVRFSDDITALAISPDGLKIAVAHNFGREVTIVEWPTGQKIATFKRAQTLRSSTLGFSADSRIVLTTPQDFDRRGPWTVGLWEATSGTLIKHFRRSPSVTDTLQELHVSPDGRFVVAVAPASGDYRILAYRIHDGEIAQEFSAPTGLLRSPVAISAQNIVAARWITRRGWQDPERVLLMSVEGGERIGDFATHRPELRAMSWSPDGRYLLSGPNGLISKPDPATGVLTLIRDDDPLRIRDASGNIVRSFIGRYDPITHVAWAPDGELVSAAGAKGNGEIGGAFRIWNARTGDLLHETRHSGQTPPGPIAFHPDRRHFISAPGREMVISQLNLKGR